MPIETIVTENKIIPITKANQEILNKVKNMKVMSPKIDMKEANKAKSLFKRDFRLFDNFSEMYDDNTEDWELEDRAQEQGVGDRFGRFDFSDFIY